MRVSLRNGAIQLAAREPLAFRGARGVHLECADGMVWLTVEGQSGDFLLAKGQQLRIESNGLALVEGFPSGAIRLASEASWPMRWGNRILSSLYHAWHFRTVNPASPESSPAHSVHASRGPHRRYA
jgi:hypothetical protein